MKDLTQSARVQTEFRRSVEALPALVWTALPDGSIDFLNQRWREYTGICVEDGYGQGWQAAIHPDDLPGLRERWQSMLRSGKPGEFEARFRRSDGEYGWFLIRAAPVHNQQRNIIGWHGIGTDIDNRAVEREQSQVSLRRAHDELEKSERQLRTIVDAIPVIAWGTLPDGSGEFRNRRWSEYTGNSPEGREVAGGKQ